MSTPTVKDGIGKARSEAQKLHQKIAVTTSKGHAMIRADLENAATIATELAASIKTLSEAQRADAKEHLKDAATQLEDAAKHGKTIAGASEKQMQEANAAMLARAREALTDLSHAIAAVRRSASKN